MSNRDDVLGEVGAFEYRRIPVRCQRCGDAILPDEHQWALKIHLRPVGAAPGEDEDGDSLVGVDGFDTGKMWCCGRCMAEAVPVFQKMAEAFLEWWCLESACDPRLFNDQ